MEKRWIITYFLAAMLAASVFLADNKIFDFSPFEFIMSALVFASFIALVVITLSSIGIDLNLAESLLDRFLNANKKKVLKFVNPVYGPTMIVTKDFNQLNPLEMEQVFDLGKDEPYYAHAASRLSEKSILYKNKLGIEFVRNDEGAFARRHFDVNSLGKKPFLFNFSVPMHHSLILTSTELDEFVQALPEQVKGFKLKHQGDSVNIRAVVDEETLEKDPKGVYEALAEVRRILSRGGYGTWGSR